MRRRAAVGMRAMGALLSLGAVACGKVVGEGDGIVDDASAPGPGWVAELEGRFHDVAGTATITEEGTVRITDFSYDGGGINARVYLVVDGAPFDRTLELSDNLVGTGPYDGTATLELEIPAQASPGSFDSLTLWCVPAAVSFGFGVFQPPEGGGEDGEEGADDEA